MITGNLQIKNDKYYAVLNLKVDGKREPRWIPTPFGGHKYAQLTAIYTRWA